MDDMLPIFLEEARENLELLGLSLLSLEQSPGYTGAINDAFRAAHSLKGMSAAMGFAGLTSVTHALEQLLEGVRSKTAAATPALVTAMLEAVDACTALVAEIETSGSEALEVGELVTSLTGFETEMGSEAPIQDVAVPDVDTCHHFADLGTPIVYLTAATAPESLMPSVRAFTTLSNLETLGTLVASNPTLESLETGDLPDGLFEAWIATSHSPVEVAAAARSCTEIVAADAQTFTPTGADSTVRRSDLNAPNAVTAALQRGSTVRIEAERLDHLMRSVGELLVRRSHIEALSELRGDPELSDAVDALGRAAQEMQSLVMDVRMIDIDTVFRRLPRLVRDLTLQLGKDVHLQISGGDTELDRTVIDLIGEPLVHLVRNAIDHGIESPDVRVSKGKPGQGTLAISATAEGGFVLMRVRDDGSGMRPDSIRAAAVRKGVISSAEAAQLSDEDALQLCFEPGFSTRTTVTEISGRGVGLDAVRASVRSIGGDVIANSSDEGTIMSIRLPLTLAIIPALLVRVASHIYAVQSSRVTATLARSETTQHSIANHPTIVFRGTVTPVIDLREALDTSPEQRGDATHIVVVETGNGPLALVVDDVVDQNEIVTRPIPAAVAASDLISASAVLGNGDVTFVLDTEALATWQASGAGTYNPGRSHAA
jgi:two-component system chemotaxis sensor kinase CheA